PGMTVRRALTIAIALLLAGQGAALAGHNDPSPHVAAMGRAAPPTSSSTTSTEAPVTTTSPTTTEVPPATTAAPRPVTTRPKTTTPRKPAAAPAPPPPPPAPNPGSITAAFYYGWYPSQWTSPGSHFHPTAGPYSSSDPATVKRQIEQMRYAGVQAAVASWGGPHSTTNDAFSTRPLKQRAFSVSPALWRYDDATPRLARDPARFDGAVKAMAASNVQWKLVTTFNEYGEGAAVEPAQEWSGPSGYGVYIDILHK